MVSSMLPKIERSKKDLKPSDAIIHGMSSADLQNCGTVDIKATCITSCHGKVLHHQTGTCFHFWSWILQRVQTCVYRTCVHTAKHIHGAQPSRGCTHHQQLTILILKISGRSSYHLAGQQVILWRTWSRSSQRPLMARSVSLKTRWASNSHQMQNQFSYLHVLYHKA